MRDGANGDRRRVSEIAVRDDGAGVRAAVSRWFPRSSTEVPGKVSPKPSRTFTSRAQSATSDQARFDPAPDRGAVVALARDRGARLRRRLRSARSHSPKSIVNGHLFLPTCGFSWHVVTVRRSRTIDASVGLPSHRAIELSPRGPNRATDMASSPESLRPVTYRCSLTAADCRSACAAARKRPRPCAEPISSSSATIRADRRKSLPPWPSPSNPLRI